MCGQIFLAPPDLKVTQSLRDSWLFEVSVHHHWLSVLRVGNAVRADVINH